MDLMTYLLDTSKSFLKSQVRAVTVDSDTSDNGICLEDCLSLGYQPHDDLR